jgi:hypothetical protein
MFSMMLRRPETSKALRLTFSSRFLLLGQLYRGKQPEEPPPRPRNRPYVHRSENQPSNESVDLSEI